MSSSQIPLWLITGCSSGLGTELAKAALSANQRVIATSRNPTATPSVVSEITSLGGTFLPLDVTSSNLESNLQSITSTHGPVTHLINNAGYGIGGSLEDTALGSARSQFETNLWGPIRTIKALLPSMRATDGAKSITNVSSATYFNPPPGVSLYAASKWALEGLSESLAGELAPFNIRVLIAEPGEMRTGFLDPAKAKAQTAEIGEAYRGTTAEMVLGYLTGQHGLQNLDPKKAAEAIVKEVLEGTGNGEGEGKVLRLPLGAESFAGMMTKAKKLEENAGLVEQIAKRADF